MSRMSLQSIFIPYAGETDLQKHKTDRLSPVIPSPSRVRTHNYIRYILPASHALSENILKKVAGIFGQSGKLSYLCTRKRGNNPGCRRYLTYFHRQEVVQEK